MPLQAGASCEIIYGTPERIYRLLQEAVRVFDGGDWCLLGVLAHLAWSPKASYSVLG